MTKLVLSLTSLSILIAGCTLYESGQHEAIETNEGGLVGNYSVGQDPAQKLYYICQSTKSLPGFLKNALEVIETKHDHRNFTLFYENISPLRYIAAYYFDEAENEHLHCKVYFIDSTEPTRSEIMRAADFAVQNLEATFDQTQDAGPGVKTSR